MQRADCISSIRLHIWPRATCNIDAQDAAMPGTMRTSTHEAWVESTCIAGWMLDAGEQNRVKTCCRTMQVRVRNERRLT